MEVCRRIELLDTLSANPTTQIKTVTVPTGGGWYRLLALRQTLTVPGTAASHAPKLYKRTGGATKDLVLQSGNQVPVGIQAVVPSSVGQLAAGATGADQSSSTFIEFFLPEGKLYWQPNPNTADTTAVVSIILGKLEG